MHSTPIRLGFIGLSATGWASRDLVPPLLKEPLSSKYSLVALSTTRAESAEASAAKYSELASEAVGKKVAIKPYYGSAEHISADKDVDMVVVSVKLTSHKDAATKVIEAGKDLFLEWPAGNHREETIELYEAAKKKGIRTAKSIIDDGEIGKIVSTTLNVSSTTGPFLPEPWKYIVGPSTGGGGIIDIVAGHSIDTLTFLLGPITSLSATVKNHASSTIIIDSNNKPTGETIAHTKPTQYCVNGLLANGATFTAHFQTGVPEPDYHWVIQGEKGTIRVVDNRDPEPVEAWLVRCSSNPLSEWQQSRAPS
ncbi:hypothetical protein D9757_010742 [Collybiopsis confluens]|uniref:Gal80p-like C-terminal domain-containing protein n=1 Tax=Collybiopsis confluens TaxID=2823264 RepID=A0A8H5GZY1_9AGAR|nr:hypothetical protein D9757_010742 [Collybiopsis confluens]